MKKFYSVYDVDNLKNLINKAHEIKASPLKYDSLGKGKLLVLLFFNASLRTKLSTQKAALNLGMQVISMDMKDSWAWEFDDGITMKFDKAEHIKEAASVICQYADIIAIRSFPSLENKDEDYSDKVIQNFIKYSSKPVINLESAIRHPLQSFADVMTIKEHTPKHNPKIVLTWAPHPKALPQAVANSFLEWMHVAGFSITIAHPEGYQLDREFSQHHTICHDQNEAFKNADFIYVKNWSSVTDYGKVLIEDDSWMVTTNKMNLTNSAKILHCLPVRRNVVISDDVMDSKNSAIIELAANRLPTAQTVLYTMLKEAE